MAEHPNEKWVTDVTEFKYGVSFDYIHKLYLSAILDLCDHRPVAYVISDHNNNQLVFDTFDDAMASNLMPGQYFTVTGLPVYIKGIPSETGTGRNDPEHVKSCSLYGDNGPMEGFWGILKREMYYK